MLTRQALAIALLALAASAASAQVRTLPADAKIGEIRHLQGMLVQIGGKTVRLAPGARIHDAQNRLVLPVALPAGAKVKYTLDAEGMVRAVWILAPEEVPAR